MYRFALLEGSVIILAETHKIIASEIYKKIELDYDVKLDKKKLLWGCIAPDYVPYYKFIRHYKDESIDYICKEIVKLIILCKYIDIENENSLIIPYLSKKIGIISHYLCDYTCYPHAYRMTFVGNMRSHIKYESDLNVYAKEHIFERVDINSEVLDINFDDNYNLLNKARVFIDNVVNSYMNSNHSFGNDLNYSVSLSESIACFIIENIINYSEEIEVQFI